MGDRFLASNMFLELDSLRREFKRPGEDQCDWEANHQQHGDKGRGPFGKPEYREGGGRDLDQQPRRDRVGNRHPDDVAALQFLE